MKKSQLDHLLRAARRITRSDQFIVIGSQSLHGRFPDLADELCVSVEADLIARNARERTEWLNAIGADSPFHETFGYYADPVDEKTAVLSALERGPAELAEVRELLLADESWRDGRRALQ